MEIQRVEEVRGAIRVGIGELDQNIQERMSKLEDFGMISKGGKWKRQLRSSQVLAC